VVTEKLRAVDSRKEMETSKSRGALKHVKRELWGIRDQSKAFALQNLMESEDWKDLYIALMW
jgi:hypothetical protein